MTEEDKKRFRAIYRISFWMFILVFFFIGSSSLIPKRTGPIHQTKNETVYQNEKQINKALQSFFHDHGRYPRYSLNELTETTHPYFEQIPTNPVTGRADWLVTNKTNYKKKIYFTQGDFGEVDVNREGIYKVKASESNIEYLKKLLTDKIKRENLQLLKLLTGIYLFFLIMYLINRKFNQFLDADDIDLGD